jgi:hypothetical protein
MPAFEPIKQGETEVTFQVELVGKDLTGLGVSAIVWRQRGPGLTVTNYNTSSIDDALAGKISLVATAAMTAQAGTCVWEIVVTNLSTMIEKWPRVGELTLVIAPAL